MNPPQAMLFDLDGTLVDTARDLANALNHTLIANGRPPLPLADIRPKVSRGAAAMLALAFGIEESEPRFDKLRAQFLQYYANNVSAHSRLFPGMDTALAHIEAQGLPWGIVTNKATRLTAPLLAALALDTRTACMVCGDTLSVCKPHPAPLLHACALLQCAPARSVYIGDAQRDIQAGKAAGMTTLVAAYGYLDVDDEPLAWGADGIIDEPAQVLAWLARRP